jgi:hypothetical protein
MKRKTSKLRKLEKNRYSVFYESLSMCCNCGSMYQITKHEILEGRNRKNSMKYGFVLPLCLDCHRRLQDDPAFDKKWKQKAQRYFEENYGTREQFIEIFRRNYL